MDFIQQYTDFLWKCACFFVGTLPQWVSGVWSLFRNDPFMPWLARKMGMSGSAAIKWWYPYIISVPLAALMWFGWSDSSSEPKAMRSGVQQHSQGANSPNVVGDHNVFNFHSDGKANSDETAKSKEPFHIDFRILWRSSVYLADDKLGTSLVFARSNTIWPIHYSIYIEVVNLQNVAAKIKSYSLHAATSASGPWAALAPIHAEGGEFYGIGKEEGFAHAHLLLFENDLENILGERPLEPREPRFGWSLFGSCNDTPKDIKFFKFTIRDYAGALTETIIPFDRERVQGEVLYEKGSFKITYKYKDISSLDFRPSQAC